MIEGRGRGSQLRGQSRCPWRELGLPGNLCCFLLSGEPSVPQVRVSAMLPMDELLSHLGPSLLLLLQLQLLLPPASAFFPNIWSLLAAPGSITHQDLTEEAALNVTLQLFLEQPPPGRPPLRLEDFLGRTLLADNLFAAYFGPGSPSRRFRAALGEVSRANAAQDFLPTSRNDPDLHFDAERLGQGRTRLVGALGETVVAARALDHTLARQRLGAALHALQDFYSHSNWVELGKQQPHPHLLWPRQGLRNLAQGFGPVFTTSDPDSFWQQLNEIHALGGGDEPEMCLSALELALLHTPPLSDIFVFTDASPKDAFLTNRVKSLTQERRCRVTFLVTEDPSRVQGRPRREVLSPLRFEPYEAVALASGGEVIFTKDQYIRDVAAIAGDSVANLVTLPLEPPVVVPERPLVFSVDGLLQRVTVRIHGEVSSFWIRNPAGVSQGQEEGEGPLGHTRRFGKFWMVSMNDPLQTGTWEIQVTAKGTPRVRVQAQTSLDFLFHFGIPMEDGPHPGLYPLTQPVAGLQTQLLVEVTGLGSRRNPGDPLPHFSHIVLRGVPHGAELGRVPLEPMGPRERGLLAASLPPTLLSTAGPFSLELIGQDGVGQGLHRAAPQPCAVVPVLLELSGPSGFLAPGTEALLSLRIASFSGPQDLDLKTSVNPSFALTSNLSRVHLEQNESAWGCLWLKVPDTAASDSVVMVTVTAMDREASTVPPTHAFLRLLVLGPAPQDQLPAPVHSTDPVLTTTSSVFHLSTLVTPGRAGGGLVGNPWRGTVGAVLLLLGLASW
ncbi:von Willebrand factor A domain-containing protein 7 isoform X9 [Physeter macrocephalus]|uniref:von Willebrand factor A domain-containing protein 7 isoform X9 n=1 Tax=Physeter macrocephalus TaxID=9755 RepID=A0A455AFR2_PHYMC|nr:von Willebrand factor A domain-containing protein 7 isoform X9 [Physeter catodon]|eukprot:XP_028334284.1 von Willebrand factor A domain-containing protein 7 isoform X7 [Physeter catodon]